MSIGQRAIARRTPAISRRTVEHAHAGQEPQCVPTTFSSLTSLRPPGAKEEPATRRRWLSQGRNQTRHAAGRQPRNCHTIHPFDVAGAPRVLVRRQRHRGLHRAVQRTHRHASRSLKTPEKKRSSALRKPVSVVQTVYRAQACVVAHLKGGLMPLPWTLRARSPALRRSRARLGQVVHAREVVGVQRHPPTLVVLGRATRHHLAQRPDQPAPAEVLPALTLPDGIAQVTCRALVECTARLSADVLHRMRGNVCISTCLQEVAHGVSARPSAP